MQRIIITLLSALAIVVANNVYMPAVVAPAPTPTNTSTPTFVVSTDTPTPTATATTIVVETPTNTPTPTATETTAMDTDTPTTTPTETDTPTVTPTPTETTQPSGPCLCDTDRYNCSSFATHSQAQACYNFCKSLGRGDVHHLDSDADGDACESLPGNFQVIR